MQTVGPILLARGVALGRLQLAALLALPEAASPPPLIGSDGAAGAWTCLYRGHGGQVWRNDFSLPMQPDAGYSLAGVNYPVAADLQADLVVAFVSCNGQEEHDTERALAERNAMWDRLAAEHAATPFSLLLQGGDQLYADEVTKAHPVLSAWHDRSRPDKAQLDFSRAVEAAAEAFYLQRYLDTYSQPVVAGLLARVPSLMMWDDHDITDGWGSLPAELLDCPVGQGVFGVARRMFMLFQLGIAPDASPVPELAPALSLGYAMRFPGFSVLLPDLRSERRPDRVMAEDGWHRLDQLLAATPKGDHILLVSSVPALGPRLSWVERALLKLPGTQGFEDDLRDQWQSRMHRPEWRRLLRLLEHHAITGDHAITIVSGEIHLATQASMPLADGRQLRQLVASGIAHRAPGNAYAIGLGWLARFGEDPLPGQPITLQPLPGQRRIYAAERNYLVLRRAAGAWTAVWELERSGRTPALAL